MLLKQLKYFIAIVEEGSFTEAAEKCFISQSAISQQISSLEESLGVQLIKRENRKFSLTPAGEYFYHEAKFIVERAEALKREIERIGKDEELQLRIGYLEGYEGAELQQTIYEFTELYPEVMLTVTKYSHEEIFTRLISNQLDLALSYQRRAFSEDYENFHLRYVPLCAEISKRNPLSSEKQIDVSQLVDKTCIINAKQDERQIEQSFYGMFLGVGSEFYFVESTDDARMMVIANRGFYPVAEVLPQISSDAIARIPLYKNGRQIHLNFCAFWKHERANYYIEEFATMFRLKFNHEL